MTAAELARELEVSERTARRDLEALALAGVPVYAQPGRGGGWSLLGGARTDLSGLTAAEVRTLFLVAGPSAATPQVKVALRKLVRALPETFRAKAEAAAAAIVVDPTDWDRARVPPPTHLDALRDAVVDGVQIRLGYAGRDGAQTERTVHPLGLVVKGRVWYLIGNTDAGLRTFRVSRVRSVDITDEMAERPPDFDLEATWRSILTTLDERRMPFSATVRADADFLPVLRTILGTRLVEAPGDGSGHDRVDVIVRGPSAEVVAEDLAGFGRHVEVVEPAEVRDHLARIGAELIQSYAP